MSNRLDALASRGVVSRTAADKATHDTTFFIVRHGATALNNETDTSVDRIRGWANVPLSEEGREEARKAAPRLAGKITAIVASDLDRAAETARIIGKLISVKPTLNRKLRPWDLGDLTGKQTKEALPTIGRYATETPDKPVPGGESFDEFTARAFEGFHEALAAHPGETVAIITHHRDERLMVAWDAQGQPPDHSFDKRTFLSKGDPPGGVIKFTTSLAALRGKLTHADAGYTRGKGGDDRCATCQAFVARNDCKKVRPPISPDGWCKVGLSKTDGHAFYKDKP